MPQLTGRGSSKTSAQANVVRGGGGVGEGGGGVGGEQRLQVPKVACLGKTMRLWYKSLVSKDYYITGRANPISCAVGLC